MNSAPEFDTGRSKAIRQILVDTAIQGQPKTHHLIPRKTLVIGSIVLGSITLLGGTAIAATFNNWIALPNATPGGDPSYGSIPQWPVNDRGQTYGVQGTSPISPDLIKAQGIDASGRLVEGYILSSDEAEPMPTSPAQALQQQEERRKNFPNGRVIPLYESDGMTVIGAFTIES